MIIESPGMLEEQIAKLEATKQDYCADLEAALDGWLEVSAKQIACRIESLDRDLSVLRDRLKSAKTKVKLYKGVGVYITG